MKVCVNLLLIGFDCIDVMTLVIKPRSDMKSAEGACQSIEKIRLLFVIRPRHGEYTKKIPL